MKCFGVVSEGPLFFIPSFKLVLFYFLFDLRSRWFGFNLFSVMPGLICKEGSQVVTEYIRVAADMCELYFMFILNCVYDLFDLIDFLVSVVWVSYCL